MSKRISDEIIDLKVVVNGDEAQKRVADLEKENNKLAEKMEELLLKQKELSKQRKKDSEEYKKAEAEVKRLSDAIADNKKKIDDEIKAMDIMSLTMQQLNKRAADLRFVLSHMAPGTAEYRAVQEELSQINTRMGELRAGSRATTGTLSNLADKFNHYSGMVAATSATLLGIGMSIQNTIDLNNKMADAQTAVAKTTGLTNQEVKELTRSFSEFDTRTKRIDLLKIAEIGGRLGVPKQEIKDFTREVDKAYVALGDSFSGGVEKVAEKIGKIKGLFKETKDLDMATAINQIGSSMNELGASGAASEENIAEFATRVGSLPDKLKPTVAEAMALGAAFEESGIDAERSATAYSNFVRTAAKESKAFAEVMGITQAEVEKLINQDPVQFFLKFSEGIKGMEATDVAKVLEHLKLNDQYVTSIVGAAAEKTDLFRKSIEYSNQALTEATSLQNEFNNVNNNAAAIYEKVRNKFIEMFSSKEVANTLNWLIEMLGRLLGVTVNNGREMGVVGKAVLNTVRVLAILTTGIVSISVAMGVYNGLIKGSIIQNIALETLEKARAIRLKLMTALQTAWNLTIGLGAKFLGNLIAFTSLQTTATNLQTIAQTRLNAAMAANPIGAIITAIGLLVTAVMAYKSIAEETEHQQRDLNDVLKNAGPIAAEEAGNLALLYNAAIRAKEGSEERKKAIEELKKKYPAYFGHLDSEKAKNEDLKKSYYELRDAIIASARARAIENEIQRRHGERLKRDLELQEKLAQAINEAVIAKKERKSEKTTEYEDDMGRTHAVSYSGEVIYQNKLQKVSDIMKQQAVNKKADELEDKPLYAMLDKTMGKTLKSNEPETGSKYNIPGTKENAPKTPKKKTPAEIEAEKAEKEYKAHKDKLLDEQKKYAEKSMDISIKLQESKLELMDEGHDKELEKIRIEAERKKNELEKQKKSAEEFKKIDEIIAKEKGDEKKKFEAIREEWTKQNASLTELQLQEKEISDKKIKILEKKQEIERIKREEEEFYRKINEIKKQENEKIVELETFQKQKEFLQGKVSKEELKKIKTWEQGKNAIQKYYYKKSLKEQKEFIETLLEKYKKIPAVGLAPEQKKALEEMALKLSEINAELSGIKHGEEQDKLSALSGFAGEADILGLSPEQWDAMFENWNKLEYNIGKVGAAMKVAQNIMNTYHEYAKANQEAELRRYEVAHERKKKALDAQLAAGLISQQEYKHQTIANENELAMKKFQLEYDAAKREKAMKIASTIANTAMSIMQVWANPGYPMAIPLSVVIGALGAVQVATIAKQPLPEPPSIQGAEDGYYPVIRKQDNKLFHAKKRQSKSGIYDEPTMLVGEQGKNFPELVVSGRAMKRIDPKLKNQFMNEVARVEGFQNGVYPTPNVPQYQDEAMQKIIHLLGLNIEVLQRLEQNGVRGVFEKSARTGKDLEEMQKEYQRLVNKNKH